MNKQVKVKILDMKYDKDNNLFRMHIEELVGDHKQVILAVAGTDFGITSTIPINLIEQFCDEMKGKEKNLYIERDDSSIKSIERDNKGQTSIEEMEKIKKNIDNYPIDEVIKSLLSESKENSNEG
jgi:hypothetical protein